ncbi:succinylglutamate desuccinylase/aspartoacylase family protein [Ovoidimarina sediminis]|uniref:succinylglutamate desuccinylase/aspartoacylase family protein n=1 Tax=Ovoidimarina sediminis TaxID=3079856 RepID=UPI00290AD059|nr:succinylglutamate desuccinylase/aspartoacylase family protein [Rhodophyticola sp. MJ-SS7]MDU8944113.1 succinylglutamate desuccinylase/aspartoacylase family protein [Rhodophyticola sp. MJ-SS7]
MLRWSDNSVPLGYHPIPVTSLKGAPGPTVLILGGTHGDEFEGPAAIMRLAARLQPAEINGQVILIPALNAPAVSASARVSPLDGQNLNRAFPGDADGGPTAMLAHYVETELLPKADAVIDLHSGGKASFFEPCALATQTHDPALTAANMALARAFGLPLIWALGPHNDSRSVNGAAARAGVPMIATELGGGGGVDPGITDLAEAGLLRCLRHLGVLAGGPPDVVETRCVEIADPLHSVYAPADGLFDRFCQAGMDVAARDLAGHLHFPHEPERPPLEIPFPAAGHVLAHGTRGMVRRGDMLALVTQIVTQ